MKGLSAGLKPKIQKKGDESLIHNPPGPNGNYKI